MLKGSSRYGVPSEAVGGRGGSAYGSPADGLHYTIRPYRRPNVYNEHGGGGGAARGRRGRRLLLLMAVVALAVAVLRNRAEHQKRLSQRTFASSSVGSDVAAYLSEDGEEECRQLAKVPYNPHAFRQVQPRQAGLRAFVLVSAFRLSATRFAVVGLSPPSLRSLWGTVGDACVWVSLVGPRAINGTVEHLFYPDPSRDAGTGCGGGGGSSTRTDGCGSGGGRADGYEYKYDYGAEEDDDVSTVHGYGVVVIRCALHRGTPKDVGGTLFMSVLGVDELVYREDPGPLDLNPPKPLPHRLTYCSTLLSRHLASQRLGALAAQHMQYMRFFGASSFVLYDGGAVDAAFRREVDAFAKAGMLDVVDMRGLRLLQVLARDAVVANECAYRTHFTSEWVVLTAMDEYPLVREPHRLPQLLLAHEERPWLSVGSLWWDILMCVEVADEPRWLVEKCIFHKSVPICDPVKSRRQRQLRTIAPGHALNRSSSGTTTITTTAVTGMERLAQGTVGGGNSSSSSRPPPELCLGRAGQRRLLFNPRKVALLTAHRVLVALGTGYDFNTSVVQLNQYRGMLEPAALVCEYPVPNSHESPSFDATDWSFRKLVHQGRVSGNIALPRV